MNKQENKKEETRLKLIITARELAKIAVGKEKVRLELVVTARELANAAVIKENKRLKLIQVAKNLAKIANVKEETRLDLVITARKLAKIAVEKEKVRLELVVTAQELTKAVAVEKKEMANKSKADSMVEAQKYNTLMNTTGMGYVTVDHRNIVLSANSAYLKLTGYNDLKQIIGKNINSWVAEYDRKRNIAEIKKCFKEKSIKNLEIDYVTGGGKILPVEINATVFKSGKSAIILTLSSDITARRKRTEELLESYSLLQSTVESTADGILAISTTGKVSLSNKKFQEMWSIPSGVMKSKDDKKLLDAVLVRLAEPKEFLDKVNYLYAHPKEESFDTFSFKDGRIFERYSTAQIQAGKTVGRVWSFRDVTVRERLETELVENEAKYKLLSENSKAAMMLTSANGETLYVSPSCFLVVGWADKDLLGKFKDFFHPDDREMVLKTFSQTLKGAGISNFRFRVVGKDKIVRWVSQSANPIIENGKLVKIVSVIINIDDIKKVEEGLRQSEKKFRTMFENAAVGISLLGLDGKWISINPALCKTVGYSKNELLNMDFIKLTLPEDIKISQDSFKRLVKGEADFLNFEKRYLHKKGYIIWVSLSISLVRDSNNKPEYFIVVTEEITERKRLEKAKGQFVALTSHQLRTPPTAINWYSEMLLNNEAGVLNEKQIKYINEIHNGNQRMIKLINSFLSVSQLQLGTIQIRPIEIDLIKGIDDVLGEFQVSVDFKKIKIIKKYDTTTEFIFKTDPNLFRIIIQNLVSNAISYTSNSGEISIKIEKRQPDNLHIEVSDNGCGIPEEAKPKIFSEFFRAENAKLIKGDGSGLGLYITKSITELFGGKISFESKEGYGTTFILEIPGRSIISK